MLICIFNFLETLCIYEVKSAIFPQSTSESEKQAHSTVLVMQLGKQIIWDVHKVLEVILCLEYAREDTECTVGYQVGKARGWLMR